MLMFSKEEELNIVALHEAEKAADKSAEYDSSYQQLKNKLENKEEDVESSDSTSEDTSEVSEENPEASDTEEVVQESFRNQKLITVDYVSLEDFSDNAFLNKIGDGLKYLGTLGIHYTPIVAKAVFKGTLKVMGAIVRSLLTSINQLTIYANRKINSFENLKKEIASAKETLNNIKDSDSSKNVEELLYGNQKIINSLKISDNIDFVSNIESLTKFVTTFVEDVDKNIRDEMNSLKHLLSIDMSHTYNIDNSILKVRVSENLYHSGEIKGYRNESDNLSPFVSKDILPGDKRLIAQLPKDDISEKEQFIEAYNDSTLFIGVDIDSFKTIDNIHYMTKDGLVNYLDSLEALCDICIKHRVLYESVIRNKLNLRYSFKNYFNDLIHRDGKTGFKNSFIEYVYLKNIFIDKVYLAAAMDVHDYTITTIKNSLSFIKDNTSKL